MLYLFLYFIGKLLYFVFLVIKANVDFVSIIFVTCCSDSCITVYNYYFKSTGARRALLAVKNCQVTSLIVWAHWVALWSRNFYRSKADGWRIAFNLPSVNEAVTLSRALFCLLTSWPIQVAPGCSSRFEAGGHCECAAEAALSFFLIPLGVLVGLRTATVCWFDRPWTCSIMNAPSATPFG